MQISATTRRLLQNRCVYIYCPWHRGGNQNLIYSLLLVISLTNEAAIFIEKYHPFNRICIPYAICTLPRLKGNSFAPKTSTRPPNFLLEYTHAPQQLYRRPQQCSLDPSEMRSWVCGDNFSPSCDSVRLYSGKLSGSRCESGLECC